MIAFLHDKNGRITVKRMYDDVRPLTKAERAAFKKLPWSDRKYAKSLGLNQLYGEKDLQLLSGSGRGQHLNATVSGVAIRVKVQRRCFLRKHLLNFYENCS